MAHGLMGQLISVLGSPNSIAIGGSLVIIRP
jgi:hypothetical protein